MYLVATVLTACGIETPQQVDLLYCLRVQSLQQYLPLAVLKHNKYLLGTREGL